MTSPQKGSEAVASRPYQGDVSAFYSLFGVFVHMLLKKAEDSYEKNFTTI